MSVPYPKLSQFHDVAAFRRRLAELRLDLPVDDRILRADEDSPLARSWTMGPFPVGNRWCIQPMEGWDAEPDGRPSPLTLRRWANFGRSGAKLIWGGEAAAVRADGRANPRQTMATPEHRAGLSELHRVLRRAHRERFGEDADLVVGLQLTHSGRFAHPAAGPWPLHVAAPHPLLDQKYALPDASPAHIWSDAELDELVGDYVAAARSAQDAGFQFVDVKACHGYLIHELLGSHLRPGPYGGDFAGRTRFLRQVIAAVQSECPGLGIGVRLSVFDTVPYESGPEGGRPMPCDACLPYRCGFGVAPAAPQQTDLQEPLRLLRAFPSWGVWAVNVTGGSPYYNPHVQRPAYYPPSDGYAPPEDPLAGVARHLDAARRCKQAVPQLPMVGSAFSYLQEYLPLVAQAVVRRAWIDSVGLGRMILSYPELPADVLELGTLARKKLCRTFSDCTTAPRHGLVSGCYPLDAYYKNRPEAAQLAEAKAQRRAAIQSEDAP